MKDLLTIAELDSDYISSLITDAVKLKNDGWTNMLEHRMLALIFEKPSLRTRVSFEAAMRQLGGQSIYLSPAEVGLGKRESIPDVARVLSRYVSIICARTFSHQTVEDLAKYASIPVINALSDLEHPCQALADLLTIYEKKGDFKKLTLAYIGDGNNVANSLLLASSLAGMNFNIASPEGYTISDLYWKKAEDFASRSGAKLLRTVDPQKAINSVDVVYTDVWTSMGQEEEAELRRKIFAGYQINNNLLSFARHDAIIMHPLPAHHGEEVAPGITDEKNSVVFDQAENRMHVQKALLARILGRGSVSTAVSYLH